MASINDNIVSFATSLAQKSEQRTFISGRKLTDKTLADLYAENWIVQKFVDVRTTDMTRLDREVLTPDFDAELYESACRRLGAFEAREDAPRWASLFGDSLLIAITDEEDLAKPVDFDVERIQRFVVLDKTGYDFDELDDDITSANFGNPRMYRILNGDTLVHNSRVCRTMAGKRSIRQRTQRNGKYGTSDIQAIKDPLFNYLTVCANIFDIVEESKTDVLYIDGFNIGIAGGREEDYTTLAKAMSAIKASTSTLMLDATARWEQKELTFTGLTDIWNHARTDLAGGLRMPLTKLFGQSASGFASGAEDAQNYREDIASLQESRLRGIDTFIDSFVLRDIQAGVNSLDFKYPSTELVNETEQSTILTNVTNSLNTLLTAGVINEAQFATELKNKDLVSCISDEDITELKELISEPTTEDPQSEIEGGQAIEAGGSVLSQATQSAY